MTQWGSATASTTVIAGLYNTGTWALMIVGFGGAGAMLRARRRRAVAA